MRKYTDCKEDFKYEIKSADGTFCETLYIPKMLVEDIEKVVGLLKEQYNDGGDGVFNGVVGFCLMHTMDYLNTNDNLEKLIKMIGDSNGN